MATAETTAQDHPHSSTWPAWLVGEMRSNHAGETGAVMIYRGILKVSRDETVIAFAQRHLATEQEHLALIESLCEERSLFTSVWRMLGWLTGALPALLGRTWVFATIEAVETFVDYHYSAQIDRLPTHGPLVGIRLALQACRDDEIAHRDEAHALLVGDRSALMKIWCSLVDLGSKAAVAVAKRC